MGFRNFCGLPASKAARCLCIYRPSPLHKSPANRWFVKIMKELKQFGMGGIAVTLLMLAPGSFGLYEGMNAFLAYFMVMNFSLASLLVNDKCKHLD